MHIIFKVGDIQTSCHLPHLIILTLLLMLTSSQTCEPFTYLTSYTKCKMSFNRCTTPQSSSQSDSPFLTPSYQFKGCEITRCITLGVDTECRNSMQEGLDESSCYKSCCKSTGFALQECSQMNQALRAKSQTVNGWLAVILACCVLVLVLFAGYFLIKHLSCLDKKQEKPEEPDLPFWRTAPFQDHFCSKCNQQSPVIELPCSHFFHFSCFKAGTKTKMTGTCPSCQKVSKVMRLWCQDCQSKYVKIGFEGFQTVAELELYYMDTRVLHLDCQKDSYAAKTDVRLTSTDSN